MLRAPKRWSRVPDRQAPTIDITDILRARLERTPTPPVSRAISAGARESTERLRLTLCLALKHGSPYPNCHDCAKQNRAR